MNMYKVVLVDDEELIIEGMKQLVDWESLGCRIEGAAYDGDEALDIINETEPDIIITDIRMLYAKACAGKGSAGEDPSGGKKTG